MSTYIDAVHPERHAPYLDIPDAVVDYLHYLDFVKMRSPRTVNGYYLDLRSFFRYMLTVWQPALKDTAPDCGRRAFRSMCASALPLPLRSLAPMRSKMRAPVLFCLLPTTVRSATTDSAPFPLSSFCATPIATMTT